MDRKDGYFNPKVRICKHRVRGSCERHEASRYFTTYAGEMFLPHDTSFEAKIATETPRCESRWNAIVYGAVAAIGKDDTGGGVREDGAHDEGE